MLLSEAELTQSSALPCSVYHVHLQRTGGLDSLARSRHDLTRRRLLRIQPWGSNTASRA